MFEYEVMTAQHYDDAVTLWEETVGTGPNDRKDEIMKYLERNGSMSYVCIEGTTGKVVGTVLGGTDGRHGYLYHLAVNIAFRHKGIGRTLVNLSTGAMKKEGIHRCVAGVKDGNDDFWKKIGWEKPGRLNIYSVVLQKQ